MSANQSTIRVVLDASEAQASARALNTEMNNIGKQAQAAGVTATQSLSAYEREIVAARGGLASLNQQIVESARATGATSQATRDLRAAYVEQSAVLRVLIAEKAQLKLEAAGEAATAKAAAAAEREAAQAQEQVAVSALEAARAEQQLALANVEVAETSALTTRQMFTAGAAVDRLAGVSVSGARGMGLLAGSFSAAAIPQLALLIGVSLLIGELVKLGKEKEKQITLDEVGLRLDAERSLATHTGTLFTKERATVIHDFIASNIALGQTLDDLAKKERAEADAIRFHSAAIADEREMTEAARNSEYNFSQSLDYLAKQEAVATAARVQATAEIQKQVESYIKLALETHLSASATLDMARQTGAATQVVEALTAALDSATFAQLRFKSGQGAISQTRFQVAHDAAASGQTLTHAESERRFNQAIAAGGEEMVKLARETELTEKNLRSFSESHHSGAAAARAYSNALVDLRKKAEESLAALNQDNFAARDAKITADIAAEKRHLAINKRDHDEALDHIATREKAMHDKVAQDRAIAEQRLQDEIRTIEIAGIQNAVDREDAALRLKLQQKTNALFQEFGVTEQSESLVLQMKEAYQSEFDRFLAGENAKRAAQYQQMIEREAKAEQQLTATIEEERLKRSQAILRSAREAAQARTVAGKFLLSQEQGASSGQIDDFLSQLKKLGPAFDDVDKKADATRQAIDYVKSSFGFASQSAEMFQLKLDLLTHHSVTFGQSMTAIFAELFTTVSGATAFFESFGQTVSNVFEGIVTGNENAKAAFLNFIASLLMQMGQMAIAIGTIYLFIPGMHGLGIGLIAAGIAAMALAGVFRGLASNAQKSGQQAAGQTGATGSSAAAPANGPAPPNVISFPTSGSSATQPMSVSLNVDRRGFKDALDGHEVVFEGMFRGGRGTSIEMVRRVRKMAKA